MSNISIKTGHFSGYSFKGGSDPVSEWRNPGLFTANAPTQFDPSSLGTWSAPDANGEYTVTMITGTAATTPATGSSLIWPCPMANGAANVNTYITGLMRVYTTGMQAEINNPLRWWAVVMNNADPTLAQGWGAYGLIFAGSSNVQTGYIYAATAGTWATSVVSVTTSQTLNGWTQATSPIRKTISAGNYATELNATRYGLAGSILSVSGSAALTGSVTIPNITFGGGAWICVGMGSSTTALPEGDYTIRAQALLTDFSQIDNTGAGDT